jgi:hypothetical protein
LTPLSPDRYRYQLTIGGATLEKLRLAKDMLRHALPSGDDEALLDRALTLLLDDLARKRFGSERSARPSREAARDSRKVPAAVKRAVWVRDLGRCAFVAAAAGPGPTAPERIAASSRQRHSIGGSPAQESRRDTPRQLGGGRSH